MGAELETDDFTYSVPFYLTEDSIINTSKKKKFRPKLIDSVSKQKQNKKIGDLGEYWVVKYEKQKLIDNSFADLLPCTTLEVEPQNALLNELKDFVSSIQTGAMPRVSGQQGLDAVEIADSVVEAIHQHHWDNDAGSPGDVFHSKQTTIVSPAAWPTMGSTTRKAG